MNGTVALSLSFQKRLTIIHALVAFKEKNHHKHLDCLLARLQYTFKEGITEAQFSQGELSDITGILRSALTDSYQKKTKRYGPLSLDELEELIAELQKSLSL